MATVEGNSGIRVWCGQKNAADSWHGMVQNAGDRRIFGSGALAALPVDGAMLFPTSRS
jgi:hypothetical protein